MVRSTKKHDRERAPANPLESSGKARLAGDKKTLRAFESSEGFFNLVGRYGAGVSAGGTRGRGRSIVGRGRGREMVGKGSEMVGSGRGRVGRGITIVGTASVGRGTMMVGKGRGGWVAGGRFVGVVPGGFVAGGAVGVPTTLGVLVGRGDVGDIAATSSEL